MYRVLAGVLLLAAGIEHAVAADVPEYNIPENTFWEFRSADESRIIYSKPGILQWWFYTGEETADSLVLPWPEDEFPRTDDVTLVLSASLQSENGPIVIHISEKRDGELIPLPLPYTTTDLSLPHSESPNCLSITDSITVSARDFRTGGDSLIIRVLNKSPGKGPSILAITDFHIEDTSSRIDIIPKPLISGPSGRFVHEHMALPLPVPITGRWLLRYDVHVPSFEPCVLKGSFILQQDSRPIVPSIDMRVEYHGERYDFQAILKNSSTAFTCVLEDRDKGESSTCRLYMLIPASPGSGDTTVVDSLGLTLGPATVQTGDLIINEIIRAPDSGSIVELRNTGNRPLEITDLTMRFHDAEIPLAAMGSRFIENDGFLCVTGDIPGDLHTPPEHFALEIRADSISIDALACGSLDSLPIPPENYSLSRADQEWILESEPTPGAENTIPDSRETTGEKIVISELHLWAENKASEFIELWNNTGTEVSVSGWKLVANDLLHVTTDTVLGPGEIRIIDPIPGSFIPDAKYGSVYLIDPDGRIIDRCSWAEIPARDRSLQRIPGDTRNNTPWSEGIPSPGRIIRKDISPHEVHVTHTHNGIVIQWTCGGSDSLTFDVFRSKTSTTHESRRVSTFPVRGRDPFSFVDLTTDPETDYTYWLVLRDQAFGDTWFGPYPILRKGESVPISIAVPHPNPFSDMLFIDYDIGTLTKKFLSRINEEYGSGRRMTLAVYSIDGRLVKMLDSDILIPGSYSAVWDGTNELGTQCPPGVYLISLQLGPYTTSVRAVFMKRQ